MNISRTKTNNVNIITDSLSLIVFVDIVGTRLTIQRVVTSGKIPKAFLFNEIARDFHFRLSIKSRHRQTVNGTHKIGKSNRPKARATRNGETTKESILFTDGIKFTQQLMSIYNYIMHQNTPHIVHKM